jgi:hypothetical protein
MNVTDVDNKKGKCAGRKMDRNSNFMQGSHFKPIVLNYHLYDAFTRSASGTINF